MKRTLGLTRRQRNRLNASVKTSLPDPAALTARLGASPKDVVKALADEVGAVVLSPQDHRAGLTSGDAVDLQNWPIDGIDL